MDNYKKLKFTDGTVYPVGTIYCIGQNYAKHALEMGSTVAENPTIFIKPPSAFIEDNEMIVLPDFSSNVHYEVELVVLIGKDCKEIDENLAWEYIAGYAVGIDVTLRDIQNQAKKEGKPASRYTSMKNKHNTPERIELKKYNPFLRRHTIHKEIK